MRATPTSMHRLCAPFHCRRHHEHQAIVLFCLLHCNGPSVNPVQNGTFTEI